MLSKQGICHYIKIKVIKNNTITIYPLGAALDLLKNPDPFKPPKTITLLKDDIYEDTLTGQFDVSTKWQLIIENINDGI